MSRIDEQRIREVAKRLEASKVFTVDYLANGLKCSKPSARLKLRQWKVHTSYNQNGRYYTMPGVPEFNKNGLWCYEGICFSRHGNLKSTVIHLVNDSSAGLTGQQLGQMLGLSARSFLHHFRDVPGLCRQKHEGVYVYYSDVADKNAKQMQARMRGPIGRGISDMDAIVILVALIKHHQIGVEQILSLPELQGRGLSHAMIEVFLESHGLEKKTPGTQP